MPKTTADAKSIQLRKLTMIFHQHPGAGYTAVELARELGCDRRTVLRYIEELDRIGQLPLYQDGEYRWRLVEDGRIPLAEMKLDLREGAALYLAARLLAQQTDERNDHVLSALKQLVQAMPSTLGPQLETMVAATATARPKEPDLSAIFSALVLGWAHHRVVEVTYRPYHPPHSAHAFTCRISPYLLEPSAVGRTVYIIGATSPHGELRTFKLERVERAVLLQEIFSVPADFDGPALVARAWGVMYGDTTPVTVRLRFSKFVRRRVRETVWHPSQHIVDLPDGGCEWEATIGDITEIGPWVRSWGRDCEVLAPEELRADVSKHVDHLRGMYGHSQPASDNAAEPDLHTVSPDERAMLDDIFG